MMLKYIQKNSLLHKMDARLKLMALMASLLSIILLPLEFAPIPFLLIISLFYIGKLSVLKVMQENKLLLIALVFPFLFHIFYRNGTADAFGIPFPAWLYFAVLNSMYLLSMFLSGILFILSTKPAELRAALLQLRMPHKLAFMLPISLQALPLLEQKLQRIRIAQASRGRSSLFALLLPALHGIFSRARKLAISLESRGFDPSKL